jgi:hypothetical protein
MNSASVKGGELALDAGATVASGVALVGDRLRSGLAFSVSDWAEFFSVDPRTVRRWVASGALPEPDVRPTKRTVRWSPRLVERIVRAKGAAR